MIPIPWASIVWGRQHPLYHLRSVILIIIDHLTNKSLYKLDTVDTPRLCRQYPQARVSLVASIVYWWTPVNSDGLYSTSHCIARWIVEENSCVMRFLRQWGERKDSCLLVGRLSGYQVEHNYDGHGSEEQCVRYQLSDTSFKIINHSSDQGGKFWGSLRARLPQNFCTFTHFWREFDRNVSPAYPVKQRNTSCNQNKPVKQGWCDRCVKKVGM